MTLPQQFRISCFALILSLNIILGIAHAEQLTIVQDPGVIGEPISFVATGELDLDASDGVAEFIVDFSPKFLPEPSSCLAAIFGIVGLTGFRQRTRSGRALRAKGGPAADSRQ